MWKVFHLFSGKKLWYIKKRNQSADRDISQSSINFMQEEGNIRIEPRFRSHFNGLELIAAASLSLARLSFTRTNRYQQRNIDESWSNYMRPAVEAAIQSSCKNTWSIYWSLPEDSFNGVWETQHCWGWTRRGSGWLICRQQTNTPPSPTYFFIIMGVLLPMRPWERGKGYRFRSEPFDGAGKVGIGAVLRGNVDRMMRRPSARLNVRSRYLQVTVAARVG